MQGQVDYLQTLGNDSFIVGSTTGQVAIYSLKTNSLTKVLINEGLSVYEMVYTNRSKRMSIACDGGMVMVYNMENYEKVG